MKIQGLFFGILLSIPCLAEARVQWPAELYEHVHPTEQATLWFKYFVKRDYRDALNYTEEHLLQKDFQTMGVAEFAKELQVVVRLLTQHIHADGRNPDQTKMQKAIDSMFERYASLEDLLAKEPEECLADTQDLDWLYDILKSAFPLERKEEGEIYAMPLSKVWETLRTPSWRSSWQYGKRALGLMHNILINRLLCVVVGKYSMKDDRDLHQIYRASGEGVVVYNPKFIAKSEEEKVQKLKKALGAKTYKKFSSALTRITQTNPATTWSYPGVVDYIPPFKGKPELAIADFAKKLLEIIQNYDAYEAAAFAHQEWVRMHMLVDGNGRMGRLLANMILVRAGFDPLIVTDDKCYTEATTKGMKNPEHFVAYLKNPSCSDFGEL